MDVIDKFGEEIVNWLCSSRLVVVSGQRYVLYWDIFRDYVLTKTVPSIPLTYIPLMQLPTALKAFLLLQEAGPMDFAELTRQLSYSNKTTVNLLSDLQTFYLVTKTANGIIAVHDDVRNASLPEIADHLARQLNNHVLMREAHAQIENANCISVESFFELFRKIDPLSNFRSETLKTYTNRLIPWLRFSGLIETEGQIIIIKHKGDGKQKAIFEGQASRMQKGRGFLCSSGPRQAIGLAIELTSQNNMDDNSIQHKGYRNAALDLINLGLAVRVSKGIAPSLQLIQLRESNDLRKDVFDLVKATAIKSPFLSALKNSILSNEGDNIDTLHNEVAGAFSRTWSKASARRYINAGKTWLRYFHEIDVPLTGPRTITLNGNYTTRKPIFLCGSTPERAIKLCVSLISEKLVKEESLASRGLARSITDLVALGLAVRTRKGIIPSPELLRLPADLELEEAIVECVKAKALSSDYLMQLDDILRSNPAATLSDLAAIVLSKVRRDWSPATAKRNISVGKTWLSFFTRTKVQDSLF